MRNIMLLLHSTRRFSDVPRGVASGVEEEGPEGVQSSSLDLRGVSLLYSVRTLVWPQGLPKNGCKVGDSRIYPRL